MQASRGEDGEWIGECRVDLVDVEMCGIVEHFGQAFCVGDAAGILGRCGTSTVDALCTRGVGGQRLDRFEDEGVGPAIVVVVHIAQGVAGFVHRLIDLHVVGGCAVLAAADDVVGAQEHFTRTVKGVATQGKAVQMRVCPPEGRLDDLVDGVQGEVGAQL